MRRVQNVPSLEQATRRLKVTPVTHRHYSRVPYENATINMEQREWGAFARAFDLLLDRRLRASVFHHVKRVAGSLADRALGPPQAFAFRGVRRRQPMVVFLYQAR